MTIRKKTILILGIGMVVMMTISIFVTSRLFMSQMDKLEIQKATLDMERIGGAIDSEITNLSDKLADWSSWDDSYQFVQDLNEAYIVSNLQTSASYESLRLNFIIFTNANGEIVYKVGYNHETSKIDKAPDSIDKYITKDKLLKFDNLEDYNSGMLMLPEGLTMVSVRQILTSNSEGPSMGTIIFGRLFDDTEIADLATTTKQPKISIHEIGDANLSGIEINILDKSNLEGRGLIKDVFGKPIAFYSVNMPRDIHLQGVAGVGYMDTALTIISIVFLISMIFLLEKLVIGQIKKITTDVNRVASSKDFSSRIDFSGRDEFGSLSKDINVMLDSLKIAKDEAFSEAEKAKSFFDVVGGIAVVIDRNGNVTAINKKGAEFLGYEVEEIVGKNWISNFVPENERGLVNPVFNGILGSKETNDDSYHENNVLLKTGKTALIGWHNSFLEDRDGQVIATVSHGQDITLKKAEEEKDKKQMEEYERLNQLMVGRELKMVELKEEIEKLKSKGGDTV